MSAQNLAVSAAGPDVKRLYRAAGISGIALGLGYIVIIALYVLAGGAPPHGAEARLTQLAANTTVWWCILGLSVLTDLLFVPIAAALYLALKAINRNAMLLAAACLVLFVVVDLAATWTSYGTLIALSGQYAAATADSQRAALAAQAALPTAILESSLFGVYAILVPGLGILISGLVMLKGSFRKGTAFIGLATGVFAILTVVGPYLGNPLDAAAIITSTLTLVWAFFVGYEFSRLARR